MKKLIGHLDLSASEIKKKMEASIYINGIKCYHSQTKKTAQYYAKKIAKEEHKKMKVYRLILEEVK